MSGYRTTPKADHDLMASARWILEDNPEAARQFLDTAFASYDRLAKFPEAGPLARLKHRKLAGVRFSVMTPPDNRWLIFNRIVGKDIEILRVI